MKDPETWREMDQKQFERSSFVKKRGGGGSAPWSRKVFEAWEGKGRRFAMQSVKEGIVSPKIKEEPRFV